MWLAGWLGGQGGTVGAMLRVCLEHAGFGSGGREGLPGCAAHCGCQHARSRPCPDPLLTPYCAPCRSSTPAAAGAGAAAPGGSHGNGSVRVHEWKDRPRQHGGERPRVLAGMPARLDCMLARSLAAASACCCGVVKQWDV